MVDHDSLPRGKDKKNVPIRLGAYEALKKHVRGRPGGGSQIQLLSEMIVWFLSQPDEVQDAVLSAGGGKSVVNQDQVRAMVHFGGTKQSIAASSRPAA